MSSTSNKTLELEQQIRGWMPILFLVDVGMMFLGLFVANAAAWWIWLPFHLAVIAFAIFVLLLAHKATRCVPQSIPLQRPIGVLLYLSCHVVQFFGPQQIPLALVGYLLFAAPLSWWFLFDHLLNDEKPRDHLRNQQTHDLPKRLLDTLAANPNGLVLPALYGAESVLKPVRFHTVDQLKIVELNVDVDEYIENDRETETEFAEGHYPVAAIDLLADVPGYYPFAVFVWLPLTGEFATFDDDHGVLRSFPGLTWEAFLAKPEKFINCSWYPDDVENHLVRPWADSRYSTDPRIRKV